MNKLLETPAEGLPPDIVLIERGWLSANNVLLLDPEAGLLIDTGYASHAQQTLSLVGQALQGRALRAILNTHLHSDHCGGNALLQQHYRCPIHIPPGQFIAAAQWDESALSYRDTGQQCPRFHPDQRLQPGEGLLHAGRSWQVHAAPGHDPDAILLHAPDDAILIAGDALWNDGFGIIFPEIDGTDAFREVELTLDLVESLKPRRVIPGHGPVINDVGSALERARKRLAYFRNAPHKHAEHAARALLMFHMLEHRLVRAIQLKQWLHETPIYQRLWGNFFTDKGPIEAWTEQLIESLLSTERLLRDAECVRLGPRAS